jgi:Na+/H+-dicarboxylate symporter
VRVSVEWTNTGRLCSLTATLASIGAAGIPNAGIVTLAIVLESVGLKAEYFAIIAPLDWLLFVCACMDNVHTPYRDRFQTVINVNGDSYTAAVVEHLCRGKVEYSVRARKVAEDEMTQLSLTSRLFQDEIW